MLNKRIMLSSTGLVVLAALFLAVVMLANGLFRGTRADLTEGNLYTISESSKTILQDLEEPITLYYFFSKETAQDIPQLRSYGQRVRELLEEYESYADDKINLKIIDPEPFSKEADRAANFGLSGVPTGQQGENFYLGLAGTNAVGETETIPFFNPQKEKFLEYDISEMIYNLAHPEDSVVGLITDLNMTGSASPRAPQQRSGPWVIVQQLRELFEVRELGKDIDKVDEDVDLLLVAHPQGLSNSTRYAIDQYVLGGGKALVFVDPYSGVDQPAGPRRMMGADQSSNLPELFKAWGIEMPASEVVADRKHALVVGRRSRRQVRHLGMLGFSGESLAQDDVITANLDSVNFGTPGHIRRLNASDDGSDAEGSNGNEGGAGNEDASGNGDDNGSGNGDGASQSADQGVKVTPLIRTSPQAMPMQAERFKMLRDPSQLHTNFQPTGEQYIVAARLHGTAKTAFPDGKPSDGGGSEAGGNTPPGAGPGGMPSPGALQRPPGGGVHGGAGQAAGGDDDTGDAATGDADADRDDGGAGNGEAPTGGGDKGQNANGHLTESTEPINVIVVADTDVLSDRLWVRQQPFFGQRLTSAFASNGDFVVNAVDNLSGSAELINIRGRGTYSRPFEVVQDIQRKAEQRYRNKERELEQELRQTEQKLNELRSGREDGTGTAILTPEQEETLERFRQRRIEIREQLRQVRHNLQEDVDQLGTTLKVINIGLMPLLVIVAAIGATWWRRRSLAERRSSQP